MMAKSFKSFNTNYVEIKSIRPLTTKEKQVRLVQKQLFIFIRKSALQKCNVISKSLKLSDKGSIIVQELHNNGANRN